MTEWDSADQRNNREKIDRARQAAEDLFKVPRQTEAAASTASRPDEKPQPRRPPRIFTVPPRTPASAKPELAAEAKPMRPLPASPPRRTGSVPSSHIGRVRALTSYGMTRAQVAELYGVSVEEIDRIVKGQLRSGKSR